MDVRQLRYFCTVADLGSFSRAAEVLHISQPALSRHVQLLEYSLDTALLSRHSRGIHVTEAGRRLIERARKILKDFDNLRELVKLDTDEQIGHLTMAVPPAVGINLMPALLRRFRERYPKITIEIWSGYSRFVQDSLNMRTVDLALIHNPEPRRGFVAVPLVLEPLCLIGPGDGDRKLSGDPVGLHDVMTLPLIMPRLANRFRARFDHEMAMQGGNPNVEIEVDGHSILMSLVSGGLGYVIDTAGAAQQALENNYISVAPIEPKIEMALCMEYWEDQSFSLPMIFLMELIPRVCRELIESGKWPARVVDQQ